ncbi:phosphoribosylglycinamide formyltransferase [Bacteroidales bacterium]
MKKLIVFASGSGTNMERIAEWCAADGRVRIELVVCNKAGAGVIDRARRAGIPVEMIDKESFYQSGIFLQKLLKLNPDLIVLAGFLWLIPPTLIEAFAGRIINIHPALLPSYGGKGMYGIRVHEAVVAAGEKVSGITIHLVNQNYDEGDILFQATTGLEPDETPSSLAHKIHSLEYRYYPEVIEHLLFG